MTGSGGLERGQLLAGAGIAVVLGVLLAALLWVAQAFDLVRWRPPIDVAMSAPSGFRDALEAARARPGEWRIDEASFDFGLPKMQLARLTATDGDLVLGVRCTDDVVDQVIIGFGNEPPSIWVHGYLYLSVAGGPVRSNWSRQRTGDVVKPWRGHDDELELLDATEFLVQLAGSTRLPVEVGELPEDPWPPPLRWPHWPFWTATFDGSGLAATLAQMGCRIP